MDNTTINQIILSLKTDFPDYKFIDASELHITKRKNLKKLIKKGKNEVYLFDESNKKLFIKLNIACYKYLLVKNNYYIIFQEYNKLTIKRFLTEDSSFCNICYLQKSINIVCSNCGITICTKCSSSILKERTIVCPFCTINFSGFISITGNIYNRINEKKDKEEDFIPAITMRRNKFGNFYHEQTGLLFDFDTQSVYGRQCDNGGIYDLNDDDLLLAKMYSFKIL